MDNRVLVDQEENNNFFISYVLGTLEDAAVIGGQQGVNPLAKQRQLETFLCFGKARGQECDVFLARSLAERYGIRRLLLVFSLGGLVGP